MGISLANLDIGGVFSGIGTLIREVRMALTGEIDPAKKAELDSKLIEIEAAAINAQNAVNLEEAKSTNWFVAGWRPAIGWVCGIALLYHYVGMQFLAWGIAAFGVEVPPVPNLDMGELTTILFGMLGLGALRTYEKTKK